MGTDLEASRLMVRHAAKLLTNKEPNYTMYCAMAKRMATDKCFNIANDAL
jgi:isobutyryl-CoA dehydrogenase